MTDDQGRFMLPDPPTATYSVWVRGYGPVRFDPGDAEAERSADDTLRATIAKTPQEAAKVYPQLLAVLMQPPAAASFPGPATPATGSVRRC